MNREVFAIALQLDFEGRKDLRPETTEDLQLEVIMRLINEDLRPS